MPHPRSVASQRPFLLLGTLVLVVAAIYWAQTVLIPLALAILITFILTPSVTFFQKRGLKRIPAVVLVVLLAFSLLGGILWVITAQVQDLAESIDKQSEEISRKFASLPDSFQVFRNIGAKFEQSQNFSTKGADKPQRVYVENAPSGGLTWLPVVARPLLELLAEGGLILMLVIFMLTRREDLRNRLLRLIGHGHLPVTTHALDEAAQRISRYLIMQLAINSVFGIVMGVGLFLIGVPYAFMCGFLTVVLRFIPYIGTWVSALLPLAISLVFGPNLFQPLAALVLIAVMELTTANVIEPILFSHSTGISSVALLVATAFWTWLWGPIGLVLAAPLSVCLAVLGRYVPPLEFLDVLLGDEPALTDNIRFYQRLLAHDQDEATEVVEEYLTEHSYETVYDDILLPALLAAKQDRDRLGLAPEDEEFFLQTTRSVLDDLIAPQQEISLIAASGTAPADEDGAKEPNVVVLACPARDELDEMSLQMLGQLLHSRHCRFEVLSARMLTAEVLSRVRQEAPAVFFIGTMPPGGLAQTRYLCKRLRAQFPDLKIIVGRWGQAENAGKAQARLQEAAADFVGSTLLESRAQIGPLMEGAVASQIRSRKAAPQAAV